jgi:hypothetical protein
MEQEIKRLAGLAQTKFPGCILAIYGDCSWSIVVPGKHTIKVGERLTDLELFLSI